MSPNLLCDPFLSVGCRSGKLYHYNYKLHRSQPEFGPYMSNNSLVQFHFSTLAGPIF